MVQSWTDADGRYLKYGPDKATPVKWGEYKTFGEHSIIEGTITLTGVTTGSVILADVQIVPKGARIEEVEVVDETASTGATAVLNIGLIRTDRTTVYDADGLVALLPLASVDTAGEKTVLRVGSTFAGALIGTTLANNGYLVADWDTAAFTAGVIKVRVKYYVP